MPQDKNVAITETKQEQKLTHTQNKGCGENAAKNKTHH